MDLTGKQGGKIINAEGDRRQGRVGQGVAVGGLHRAGRRQDGVGIAILNASRTASATPTTWHVRDYGLFAANPFGWKDFGHEDHRANTSLPAGDVDPIRRTAIILHEGDTPSMTDSGRAAFEGYAHRHPKWSSSRTRMTARLTR